MGNQGKAGYHAKYRLTYKIDVRDFRDTPLGHRRFQAAIASRPHAQVGGAFCFSDFGAARFAVTPKGPLISV